MMKTHSHIPEAFIEELLIRTDIVELIGSRIPLKKSGTNYVSKCPFHSEKTPSFTVNQTKQFYHCFGCGAHGGALRFLMDYEGIHFVEACETLAQKAGLQIPVTDSKNDKIQSQNSKQRLELYKILKEASLYFQKELKSKSKSTKEKTEKSQEKNKAVSYLKERGITGETAKMFALGYAKEGWDHLLNYFLNKFQDVGIQDDEINENNKTSETNEKNKENKENNGNNGNKENNENKEKLLKNLTAAGLIIYKDKGRYYDRFHDRVIFTIRDIQGRVIGFGGRKFETRDNVDRGNENKKKNIIENKYGHKVDQKNENKNENKNEIHVSPKYLNSPETLVFNKGQEIYGLYEARLKNRQLSSLIVVEGYIDVITLFQAGIENVVATLGTALTERHLELLFRQVSELYFCFDGDNAGKEAATRALHNSLPLMKEGRRVKFVFLPNGEDPDSFVRQRGKSAFLALLQEARSLSEYVFDSIRSKLDLNNIDDRAEFVSRARPLIDRLPKGVLQQMMRERLKELSGMAAKPRSHSEQSQPMKNYANMNSNMKSNMNSNLNSNLRYKSGASGVSPPSLILRALALLLENRNLLSLIPEPHQFEGVDLPGGALFCAIIRILREDALASMQVLEERLTKECADYFRSLDLKAMVQWIPEEGIEAEFSGALVRIKERAVEQTLENLLKKAKIGGLTGEEKDQLTSLISQKEKNRVE